MYIIICFPYNFMYLFCVCWFSFGQFSFCALFRQKRTNKLKKLISFGILKRKFDTPVIKLQKNGSGWIFKFCWVARKFWKASLCFLLVERIWKFMYMCVCIPYKQQVIESIEFFSHISFPSKTVYSPEKILIYFFSSKLSVAIQNVISP